MSIPEGRYLWHATASAEGFYPRLNGVIVVQEGQVQRLDLDFTPLPSIPLLVRGDTAEGEAPFDPDDCWVGWEVRRGDEVVSTGSDDYGAHSRVPVQEGCETIVTVQCGGFQGAVATAQAGMAQLEIVLVSEATGPMPEGETATLIVSGAAGPPGKSKSSLRATLEVRLDSYSQDIQLSTWGEEAIRHEFTIRAIGTGTVTLRGGKEWGYPGGVLAGPVEFAIADGETRHLELPAIASPPWEKPIRSIKVYPTASGCPLSSLHTHLRFDGLEGARKAAMFQNGTIDVLGYPLALTDGRDDYPIEFTPADDGVATLKVDLPHTLEVRVTRNGKPVDKINVHAMSVDVTAPDLPVQCSADSIDGVAKLWIPRGRADVSCWVGQVSYSRRVEVTPGQVTLVNVDSPLIELTLEVGGDPYDPYGFEFDAPQLWKLEQATGDGGWAGRDELSETSTFTLSPGTYRAMPWSGGDGVVIELSDDKTVRLPAIAIPTFGSAILKYDVAILGKLEVGVEFGYALIGNLVPHTRYPSAHDVRTTVVADGFKVSGLPLGADIAIWGGLTLYDGETEARLLLRPLKLRLSKDGQVVEADIRREVKLHDEWGELDARWATPVENLTLPVREAALPGRQELLIYGVASGQTRESVLYREWVVVPDASAEPFRIPADLRRELEARKLIGPADDE
jgi:hypothetical protein